MQEKKRKRYQMAFDINEELHKAIKISAVTRNISMNMWMHRAIIEKLKKEEPYKEEEKT